MPGRRFPHLGWTLDRWRDPPRYDHRNVRPYGPGGALITDDPVGILVIVAILRLLLLYVPEARVFFAAVATAGIAFGLFLRFRHR